MSFSLSSQQYSATQMQTDYSAATLNGRTLGHCLGETARAEVFEILLGKQHTM